MNKLETITQLLVNELTDFDKNVQQLSDQMERAESLRIKFDLSPIKGLISQLEELGRHETERREQYLDRLERNLEQAKIYPKWAVITFMVTWTFALGAIFYIYLQASNLEQNKRDAYQLGIQENQQFLIKFFDDNPKIRKEYEKWMKNN
ncbi:DUF6730 family protein [Muricauda sp. MAR_2010_75]|uniref:DUF6730 family protein n=1 Tax=Allomuricauda sp. MAR_2010_75 TaxID=1250232 RepID=UPI00056ACFF5|nr:DUF6730 family protein [Muricauda sp. MAR_2010_75]